MIGLAEGFYALLVAALIVQTFRLRLAKNAGHMLADWIAERIQADQYGEAGRPWNMRLNMTWLAQHPEVQDALKTDPFFDMSTLPLAAWEAFVPKNRSGEATGAAPIDSTLNPGESC